MRLGDLLNVTELRELIKSRHVLRRNHPELPLAILNYSNECMFDDYWPETVQHCRGLIINPTHDHEVCSDCEVISRPFHKFFNLNHQSQLEYHEANLPKVEPTVTEKMDGWFGIMWQMMDTEGNYHAGVASRGSFTSPGALFATDKLRKLVKYGAIFEFPKGYTPIFEIIFKAGKIVVDYPFEGLVLLGLVNNETGEELPYDELQSTWAKIAGYAADNRPWIRLVKSHRMSIGEAFASSEKNFEGYVLNYPRAGTWPIKIKVKLDDYKRLHKLITGVTPQQIWGTLHDPMAPWVGANVPAHFRAWATQWRDKLYSDFQVQLGTVMGVAREVHLKLMMDGEDDRDRRLVFEMLKARDADLANIAMTMLDGKIYAAHQAIWERIRPVGREEVFYREGQGE